MTQPRFIDGCRPLLGRRGLAVGISENTYRDGIAERKALAKYEQLKPLLL